MKRIIYPNAEGGVAVIVPAPDCGLSIKQIALKDVPAGVPYKIVDTEDIPTDRTFRAAWEADMANPHGEGADYGSGSVWAVVAYQGGVPVVRHEETGEIWVAE